MRASADQDQGPGVQGENGPVEARIAAAAGLLTQGGPDAACAASTAALAEATAAFGPEHPLTLRAGALRARVAEAAGDYHYAALAWCWIALRHRRPGGDRAATGTAARAAITAWKRLPEADERALAPRVLAAAERCLPADDLALAGARLELLRLRSRPRSGGRRG